jgi:cytochrome c peroxidase
LKIRRRIHRIAPAAGVVLGLAGLLAVSGMGGVATRSTPLEGHRRPKLTRLVRRAATTVVVTPRGEDADPPEVTIGERLFLETRFAQFFAVHMSGVNAPLAQGDPVLDTLRTSLGPLAGPFAGKSMNCRNCHLVDDTADAPTRAYADFSRKSLVPVREDGMVQTPRNSPTLVNALLPRSGPMFLHFDGEFTTPEDLVQTTMTGRNYGWLPLEAPAAIAHIARVIREDNGTDDLGPQYGGSYPVILTGTDPSIPPEFRLPETYRIDVATATDAEIVQGIAKLIGAYMGSLTFANSSPYDVFLAKNGLPAAPADGESDLDYSRRLRSAVEALANPQFVDGADGEFGEHDQDFVFGPDELKGLKIFLREPLPGTLAGDPRVLSPRTGNCISCHAAPNFTDFSFHNTGATEEEFDGANGDGAFARLFIPDLDYRGAHHDEFLPPTPEHPAATGSFKTAPGDLGLWNVFANPDFPAPQQTLNVLMNPDGRSASDALRGVIGYFKTPGLRDLGQSGPYLHTGKKREIEEVLEFYVSSSNRQRQGRLRNGSPELAGMFLSDGDIDPVAAFLRSLNEDYN